MTANGTKGTIHVRFRRQSGHQSALLNHNQRGRRAAREDRVYVPQHALELPNDITSDDIEIATGDVWPSRKKQIPQKALEPNNLDDHAYMRTNR
jgi:hypothetical protein